MTKLWTVVSLLHLDRRAILSVFATFLFSLLADFHIFLLLSAPSISRLPSFSRSSTRLLALSRKRPYLAAVRELNSCSSVPLVASWACDDSRFCNEHRVTYHVTLLSPVIERGIGSGRAADNERCDYGGEERGVASTSVLSSSIPGPVRLCLNFTSRAVSCLTG